MPRKKKESKIIPFNGGKGIDAPTENVDNEKDDIPKVPVELVDTKSVEQMSVAELNRLKQELQAQRERVMLSVDQKKLVQAGKLISLMDSTLNRMQEVLFSDEPDSRAYKEYAEAYDRLNRNLSSLSRLDTNCDGEFMEIHLSIKRNG